MNPTALVPGAWKDLLDRLPEAERAVADGQVRRDLEPTPLDVDEELTPALRALAHPGLEADEFLLALGCRADQHQHAFGGGFHPRLQVNPVRPHIDIAPRREIALLPRLVVRLPLRRQPGDHRRRQVRRVLAQESGEGLLEVAGRNATQVQDRKQSIEALRPPRPFRQDRRSEPDLLRRAHLAAVADLRPPDRDRPDPGLDRALRSRPSGKPRIGRQRCDAALSVESRRV